MFYLLFIYLSIFGGFLLRHLIRFVGWLPLATSLSESLCGCVIYLAILEIHVGVSIAIRALIKASHAVLPLRRRGMKRANFSLMGPPGSRPVN